MHIAQKEKEKRERERESEGADPNYTANHKRYRKAEVQFQVHLVHPSPPSSQYLPLSLFLLHKSVPTWMGMMWLGLCMAGMPASTSLSRM